jgi:hypothetical protein
MKGFRTLAIILLIFNGISVSFSGIGLAASPAAVSLKCLLNGWNQHHLKTILFPV